MQRVVGHVVLLDVGPDLGPGPVGEGADLAAAVAVVLIKGDIAPRAALLAAQAGDPGPAAGEHAPQRLHLAHAAAGLAQLDALVHRILTLAGDELDDGLGHRLEDLDLAAVAFGDPRQQGQRLGVQLAGVQRRDVDGQLGAGDQVGDDHVLYAQAAALHQTGAVLGMRRAQALQCGLDLGIERRRPLGIQADGMACRWRRSPGQAAGLAHAALRRNQGRVSLTSPW
mmetsp:Transcript_4930/g.17653  ORF Transcript_4930/g.17653 Transcript_4930/m.17653 type:complete len:226 (+) Transcript_4930:1220-1897(+)